MNKFRTTCAGVVAGLLLSVNAGAATIWQPTDVTVTGNVNVLQVDFLGLSLNGGTLALFADDDALVAANALVLGSLGGTFAFTDNENGTYDVEAIVGGLSQGVKVIDGDEFVLGVIWGGGYVSDDSAVQDAGDPTTYVVSFNDGFNGGTSLVVDVAAVPLPAAAWLFGAALLGLVGVKRRQQV
jgi:hypothetical protein